MKLTCILMMCALMEVSAATYAQKITLSLSNASLENAMEQIKKQSGFNFIYDADLMQNAKLVSINVQDEALEKVLKKCFAGQPVTYLVNDKTIVLRPAVSSVPLPNMAKTNVAEVIISGTVVDNKGLTLPGVTVKIKGTNIGTITDGNGHFSLKSPSDNVILIFTFIGYTPQEYTYIKGQNIRISLKETNSALNEVVVVGYGTQTRETVVGAISSISTKDLVQSPTANISNSLAGRLPGITATQVSGEPGNDVSNLRIRGTGTFSGSSDPLVLIDGIEALSFNNIDPSEIESVTVLKDASSTAVYGIRGANGVIIITTRRGVKGPPTIDYNFQQAINSFTNLRKGMDAYDYANSLNQALQNDAYASNTVYVPKYNATDLALFQSGTDPVFHPSTDWYDVLLKKTSAQQRNTLNISGGTDKVTYFISGSYFTQDGLFKDTRNVLPDFDSNSDYKRYTFRSNLNFKVNKRLRIAFDASSQTESIFGHASATNFVIENIARANPVGSPGIEDGKLVYETTTDLNPLAVLLGSGVQTTNNNYLNGKLRIDHDLDFLTPGLTIHADVAYQNFTQQKTVNSHGVIQYTPLRLSDGTINYIPQGDPLGPFGFSLTNGKYRRTTVDLGIDYKRTFGGSTVSGLILYNQNKLFDPTLAFDVPKGYQSLVGRGTYNYKSRYLLEVDMAYNGTEQFAPGKRFGYFPSISAGWVPTQESFFPKNKIVNYIKIRGSYGQVGNDQIGGTRFLYNPTSYTYNTPPNGSSAITSGYYFGTVGQSYTAYNGLVEGKAGNPNLTWERANKLDIGTDIRMFNENLSITADYFHESRNNILATPSTVSTIVGYVLPAYNLGKMDNQGFEVQLGYNSNIGDFKYNIGGNVSYAHNKIIYQDELPQQFPYLYKTGQSLGQTFGFIAEGLFNSWAEVNDPKRPVYLPASVRVQPGDIRFKDVNGDGVIDQNDMVPIGYSTIPEITYGITLGGSYKGFDFSVLFQGVGNVSAPFSGAYARRYISGFYDSPNAGAVDYLVNSWTPQRYAQGLPIEFPRFSAVSTNINYSTSTYFLQNARYLRLKNLEVGYSFKSALLNKISIKSARIYANGNNLITWSGLYPGVDPESVAAPITSGVTSNGNLVNNNEPYPLVRTFNIGVNLKF